MLPITAIPIAPPTSRERSLSAEPTPWWEGGSVSVIELVAGVVAVPSPAPSTASPAASSARPTAPASSIPSRLARAASCSATSPRPSPTSRRSAPPSPWTASSPSSAPRCLDLGKPEIVVQKLVQVRSRDLSGGQDQDAYEERVSEARGGRPPRGGGARSP